MRFLSILLQFNLYIYASVFSKYINNKNCDQIIDKSVYTICYNYKLKGAKFVAYSLDGSKVDLLNIKKQLSFYDENSLNKRYRSYTSDYKYSRYDKVQLASDDLFDYGKDTQYLTYSMVNTIPMLPRVYANMWIKAEQFERTMAIKFDRVDVINGVVYSKDPKRIGNHKIAVPDAFWKMIFNVRKNYKICLYYKNNLHYYTKNDKIKYHRVNCNGIKF